MTFNENSEKIKAFRSTVWDYYKKNGRHDLPWRSPSLKLRGTKQELDPYKILVSEMMLQQTQVSRVVEKYKSFIKKFPTVRHLSRVTLAEVLKEWNGLGYNRRGKYLHDAAKVVIDEYDGDMKSALADPLPGVGPYTRAAVRTFAFNEPHEMIETNIRTVFIHHFFPASMKQGGSLLHDREILKIAARASEGQDPRTWHWALMDYGAFLKRSGVRNNNRSKQYIKQSKFEGSLRQLRGAILRELHDQSEARGALAKSEQGNALLHKAFMGLERDGLIKKEKGKWRIA